MVNYLLDTCVMISLFKGKSGIQERIWEFGFDRIHTSEFVIAELLVGAYKSGIPDEMKHIRFAKDYFHVLPVTSEIFDRYAFLRASLERSGARLDSIDLLIAATALENDLILVTGNTRHFARIPDLKMENWIVP